MLNDSRVQKPQRIPAQRQNCISLWWSVLSDVQASIVHEKWWQRWNLAFLWSVFLRWRRTWGIVEQTEDGRSRKPTNATEESCWASSSEFQELKFCKLRKSWPIQSKTGDRYYYYAFPLGLLKYHCHYLKAEKDGKLHSNQSRLPTNLH